MEGEAGVESQAGNGSTFWFTAHLQRGQEQAAEDTAYTQAAAELEIRKHTGAHLLLVEDNPINREVALELLSEHGLIIDTAEDGLEAVAKVCATNYQLILMDVQMPKLDGLNAAKLIRALPYGKDTPILAMTANAFNEDREDCLQAGMNDFVAKPVEPKVFYATIAKWLATTANKHHPDTHAHSAEEKPYWQQQLLEIPGLDVELGLSNVSGKMATYLKVLHLLIEHHAMDPQQLTTALNAQNLQELQRLTHRMKGAIGSLGATAIAKQAAALDLALHQQAAPTELAPLCNRLANELANLIAAVKVALAAAEQTQP